MLTSLVLDALLILILLMMVPLGFLRGGLRELCTSAALLLGILMAEQWSPRWAGGLTSLFDMGEGTARFTIAVLLVVVVTGVVGYGGSAAFSWRPGPGGRMYGAFLALLNAMVFTGFLINTYVADVFGGELPETIGRGYVSRALSVGFEWVLLAGVVGILGATVFGMFVRERGDVEETPVAPTAEEMYRIRYEEPRPQVRPLNEPETNVTASGGPSRPVRIREVRHWEDEPPATIPDSSYGSGWRQTWPEDAAPTTHPSSPQGGQTRRLPAAEQPRPSGGSTRDVLRDWMKNDSDRPGKP